MQIDFSVVLNGLDGKPLEETDTENKSKKQITLGLASANSLLAANHNQTNLDEKLKRYKLAFEVSEGGTKEISSEQAQLIRQCANAFYGPLVLGQICEHVE